MSKPTMNPTVEDEGDDVPTSPMPNPKANSNENDKPLSWSEIFSRHEAFLCSHLKMLNLVKEQVAPEVTQTVSSMMNKTVQAMNQLKVARKLTMSSMFQDPTPDTYPTFLPKAGIDMTSEKPTPSTSTNTTQSTDTEANTRKKRRRVSRDHDTVRGPTDEMRAPKRHRDSPFQPTTEPDGEFTSSHETEDISAEVQRRLKIKEEQRLKRENSKPDKRKRDSLASNEGDSSIAARPRKKRLIVANAHKRHGDLMEKEADSTKKKQRKSP
ncbi:uncharacterized protein PGRI_079400 [Penicillium griseofulvum]|uniref:Uncharacterized protein n=1 Tax=Penicillium patulum TaxID=5078 RepID=A0A135LUN5_PENPA|nr:uncharacterized protein PGRI_079400 [Penicillium griseofulvum]KXG52684.1 hypothetical protein PGRI_079400 [Penicillium griseofulvum]